MRTAHETVPTTRQRRGGWGWVLLPLLLMMLGSNVVWGLFMTKLGDPAAAGKETLRVGPLTWSLLQLVLLWIAQRQLRKMGRPLKEVIGFSAERLGGDLAKALGLAAVSTLIIVLFTQVTARLLLAGAAQEEAPFYPWALIWWTTIGSLTAGLGEEAYFRGFLMARLQWLRPGWRVVVTSLGFALWHANPLLLPHTFVIGLLYGWMALREGRLAPVILGHILTNTLGGVLMLLGWA